MASAKGIFASVGAGAIAFVIMGIILSQGAVVQESTKADLTTQDTTSVAFNATIANSQGIQKLSAKQTTIGTIYGVVIIIMILGLLKSEGIF